MKDIEDTLGGYSVKGTVVALSKACVDQSEANVDLLVLLTSPGKLFRGYLDTSCCHSEVGKFVDVRVSRLRKRLRTEQPIVLRDYTVIGEAGVSWAPILRIRDCDMD